ncbi:MAG: DinB family protein [Sphingobacteriales bacterium]
MINKPQPGEYAPYAEGYIAKVPDGPVIEILAYLKQSTYNFFSRITTEQADYAYAEGKWTLKQVLGHMIDTERVFSFRALCFSRGDKNALPGFDQEEYVAASTFDTRTIQDLANEFKTLREANIYLYNSLTEEQSLKMGVASNHPVSVRALVYMTAGHEIYHLDLIKERYIK